ncbi:ATP-binding protein [Streptacidiphilus cavernicola]|uniref:ATP-binding protein n=1 Tax=Streptacidiphilus cavernicola TaxID=3342716 RepID=A0ABV6VP16_9ACTN
MTQVPSLPHAFAHMTAPVHVTDEEIRASVRSALDHLRNAVTQWSVLQPGAMADLLLAGAELTDNALRHVGACSVRVRWVPGTGRVRLEVADTSPAFPQVGGQGRGLHLVHALAADWGCEKDGAATGKVVFVEVTPAQSLCGDDRLKALVRRHPGRVGDDRIALHIAGAVAAAKEEAGTRELVNAP